MDRLRSEAAAVCLPPLIEAQSLQLLDSSQRDAFDAVGAARIDGAFGDEVVVVRACLADPETRGTLVGWFYAWAYLGFGAPFLIAWLTRWMTMPRVLLGGSALAALATVTTHRATPAETSPARPP